MVLAVIVDGAAVSLPGVLALGAGVGYLAGMFGVGGGFMLTPLLAVVFGVPLPIAVGTGLCLIVGTALSSLLRHRQLHQGEPRFDLIMLAGSVVGVDAGARTLVALAAAGSVEIGSREVPWVRLVVNGLYIVVLFGAAVMFWVQARGRGPSNRAPLAHLRLGPSIRLRSVGANVSVLLVSYIGLGLGFLAGLLGIGGGVALMPVLVYGFGFPMRQAAGTGILVLLCSASYGTFVQALRGNVHLGLAMALMVSAAPMAQLGALATRRLSPALLRRGFAAVLFATAAAVAWDLARRMA